jgi:hypothetical protein
MNNGVLEGIDWPIELVKTINNRNGAQHDAK